jgi:hypothetical protein
VTVAVILAFVSHVVLQEWGNDYLSQHRAEIESLYIQKPPYGTQMKVFGLLTSFIPLIASFFVLRAIWTKLPFSSWWGKGVFFAALLLMIKSELIRTPIMGLVAGAPIWVIAIGQLDVWVPNLLLGLVLAYGINYSTKHAA